MSRQVTHAAPQCPQCTARMTLTSVKREREDWLCQQCGTTLPVPLAPRPGKRVPRDPRRATPQ